MAAFVLVHGAWGGAHGWRHVRRRLTAAGYDATAPSLTGIGERVHLVSPQVGLSTHVTDVVHHVLYEDLTDVVLVGFSYGGMVVTGVADRAPERVAALAYLDAFLPEDGQSLFDINIPANTQRFIAQAGASGGLLVPSPPAAFFNVNAADAGRVDALATPFPLGCFTEKIKLSGAHKTVRKRAYVHGTVLPRESPFKPFYERAKADPAWHVSALACGHHVMLDEPERVTAVLENLL